MLSCMLCWLFLRLFKYIRSEVYNKLQPIVDFYVIQEEPINAMLIENPPSLFDDRTGIKECFNMCYIDITTVPL